MSLSDCEKCWETPCVCGYTYKKWKTERIVELRDVLNKTIYERSDNSDYAKLPSLHDVMDIIRPNGAGQEIPEIVRRVYETIKKLGNFA